MYRIQIKKVRKERENIFLEENKYEVMTETGLKKFVMKALSCNYHILMNGLAMNLDEVVGKSKSEPKYEEEMGSRLIRETSIFGTSITIIPEEGYDNLVSTQSNNEVNVDKTRKLSNDGSASSGRSTYRIKKKARLVMDGNSGLNSSFRRAPVNQNKGI